MFDQYPRHKRIRLQLRARNISQEAAAYVTGRSRTFVNKVLNGRKTSEPLLDELEELIRDTKESHTNS